MLSSGPLSPSLFGTASASGVTDPAGSGQEGAEAASFLGMVDSALRSVSGDQNAAAAAESRYVTGAPGATLGQALVASDRAEIGWNAAVAVRNEIVSAYQSIMSMQF